MKFIAEQYELSLPVKPGKPRYSYSALEQAKCGARYYYTKQLGVKDVTYNLAAGTLLDTAFNAYYENNQHLSESHEERMEYARAAVDLAIAENPKWLEIEWSKKPGDVRSSPENFVSWLFDHGALALVCKQERGPVEVQKKVELELPNYSIIGYIDCIETNTNTVVDIKAVAGWSELTPYTYGLRSQVSLYRMILADTTKQETKGRYELVLCRKRPTLQVVPDFDIPFLQDKLIKDFDAHHEKMRRNNFEKNPEQCMTYNRLCPHLEKCWPQLAALKQNQ